MHIHPRISPPDLALIPAVAAMAADFAAHDPAHAGAYLDAARDPAAWIRRTLDEERGIDLLPGYVPCTHRWLVIDVPVPAIVGVVRVRHHIDTPFLAEEAGHIGYDVPPSWRRRGYGLACLRVGLSIARDRGLGSALLFADTDNVPSWRIIERCGGILEREWISQHFGTLTRRYRIDLARSA